MSNLLMLAALLLALATLLVLLALLALLLALLSAVLSLLATHHVASVRQLCQEMRCAVVDLIHGTRIIAEAGRVADN